MLKGINLNNIKASIYKLFYYTIFKLPRGWKKIDCRSFKM